MTTPQSFVKAALSAEREQWTGVDKLAEAIDRDQYRLAMQSTHTQIGLEAIGNLVRTNLQHGGFLVAEFRGSDGHPHSEEAKANAALFAAAPELLTALQSIADCCEEDRAARDYASRQTEIRGIARAAIAKAGGAA